MAEFDWEEKINMSKMRSYRLSRMDEQMEKDEIDCLVTMRIDNVRYMTSFRPNSVNSFYFFRYAAVKAKNENPYLMVASGDFERAMTYMPWIEKKVKALPMDPMLSVQKFKEVFEELNLPKGSKIGIDEMGFQLYLVLCKEFPEYVFVDGKETLAKAKSIKCQEEVDLIEKACIIAETGIQRALNEMKIGMNEMEISAMIQEEMIRRGSEGGHTHPTQVNSGENAVVLTRFPTERVVRNGDFVLMDVGCCYNGYHSDFCRTVLLGEASEEQKKVYTAVYHALQAAIGVCKPGVSTAEVDRASRDVLRAAGYEKYWFFGVTGHGIGISLQEHPFVGEQSAKGEKPWILEPGMVFSIEPSVHLPGVGGVRLEDVVAITEDGCKVLSRVEYQTELILK